MQRSGKKAEKTKRDKVLEVYEKMKDGMKDSNEKQMLKQN